MEHKCISAQDSWYANFVRKLLEFVIEQSDSDVYTLDTSILDTVTVVYIFEIASIVCLY